MVMIMESNHKMLEVEATNHEEAERIVEKMYDEGKIDLGNDNFKVTILGQLY